MQSLVIQIDLRRILSLCNTPLGWEIYSLLNRMDESVCGGNFLLFSDDCVATSTSKLVCDVAWWASKPCSNHAAVPRRRNDRDESNQRYTLSTSSIQFTPEHTKWVWQQQVSIIGDLDWMFSVITKYATDYPQTATHPIANGTAWQDGHHTPH